MAKSRSYLVPIFQEKYDYFFLHFGLFWWKKERGQGLIDPNKNLTYPTAVSQFWGIFQSKNFCSSSCRFCGYRCQSSCFFDFEPLFGKRNRGYSVLFLFGSIALFGWFNKIHVFRFSGPFRTRGKIFSRSRRWRKINRIF